MTLRLQLISWCCLMCIVLINCTNYTSTTQSIDVSTRSQSDICDDYSGDCGACVKHGSCFYCQGEDKCHPFPKGSVLPHKNVCSLSKARWGVCWVNYEILLITMGTLAGLIILTTCCCVYCCCCRGKKGNKKYRADEARQDRETEERHARNAERRQERQGRLDEIRKKYGIGYAGPGLVKDDNPYQRFDA